MTVTALDKDKCFGEMALLSDTPRSATVLVAAQPTVLLCLFKNDLRELLVQYPSLALSLNRILAGRIEEMNVQEGFTAVDEVLRTVAIEP